MPENSNSKPYDLDERTYKFALACREFVKKLPRAVSSIEYGKQLIRSSGSQAANYIEANEALSKKDFLMRIKISRKETKESCLWLRLSDLGASQAMEKERDILLAEAVELRKIFSAILKKSS